MTRFFAWAYGVVNDLRKPLNKDGYRVLGMVAVLVALSAATIGFIVVPRWEFALICAILSLPGSLFAGMLSILWLQRQRAARRRDMRWMISGVAMLLVAIGAMRGLHYALPSALAQIIVITVAVAVITIARHVWRNSGYT